LHHYTINYPTKIKFKEIYGTIKASLLIFAPYDAIIINCLYYTLFTAECQEAFLKLFLLLPDRMHEKQRATSCALTNRAQTDIIYNREVCYYQPFGF